MLHVYMTIKDSGKGQVPLTHLGSVATWSETHSLRRKAFNLGSAEGSAVHVRIYDDAGKMLVHQASRGTF